MDQAKWYEKLVSLYGDRDFAEFFSRYPWKIAHADAFRAWKKTAAARPPIGELLAALDLQVKARAQMEAAREFVPHWPYPQKWLTHQRWDDQPQVRAEGLQKSWHETAPGIEAKGHELGVDRSRYPHFPAFKAAVFAAAKAAERGGNVVPLARRA